MDELPQELSPELARRIANLSKEDQEMIIKQYWQDVATDKDRARAREEKAKKILG